MLTSYLTMQNAILAQNMTAGAMVQNANKMLSSVAFGNSLPLKPSFYGADKLELQNKANETKISVLQKFIDSISAKLGKDIKRSTPKYAGVDYKA